jgi:DNA-binding response OmpR family regulator
MKKILIVEDDLSIAEVEKDYLEINGFAVDIENTGTKGLERALDENYNLIILDLMLPGADGFMICKEVRKRKDIPIIMISARGEDIDKIRGLGLGLDDYMTKPFSPNELVARVKAHIKRYETLKGTDASSLENSIRIRGLEINPKTHQVFIDGREVILTVKEFELLQLLAGSPNKVFTKEEIFQKVWGFEADQDIPTITVHIRRIREKIEKDPSEPEYVKTIWGVGYKLN